MKYDKEVTKVGGATNRSTPVAERLLRLNGGDEDVLRDGVN